MNTENLRSTIETSLPLLFECTEVSRHEMRIKTPLMYPDGEVIDVHVTDLKTHYNVTDFGETLGWIHMQTIGAQRSPMQNRMIEDVCQTLGINLVRGQLTLQVNRIDALAEAITLVAQAALRISDLLFTLQKSAIETISDETENKQSKH